MDDQQPFYPYRDTRDTGDGSDAGSPSGQYPQQQMPYGTPQPQQPPYQQYPQQQQPQYPQQQYQPMQPQPQGQWSQPNMAGMPYGVSQLPPTNALAMAALVCGICATVFSLVGYVSASTGTFAVQALLSVSTVAMGIFGMVTGKRTGLRFGHALLGTVLGAFGIVLFCTLAASQPDGLESIFSSGDPGSGQVVDDPRGDDDDDDTTGGFGSLADLSRMFDGRHWEGTVSNPDGTSYMDDFLVQFVSEDGEFDWSEMDASVDARHAGGSIALTFGEDAMDKAKAEGFDLEALGGEDTLRLMQGYDEMSMEFVYMELDPSESDSLVMPSGSTTRWFGYVTQFDDLEDSLYLTVIRPSDTEAQMFWSD